MPKTKKKPIAYDINWEAVQTVDDVKSLLKAIELRIVIHPDDIHSMKKLEYLTFKNFLKLN